MYKFGLQLKLVRKSIVQSLNLAQEGFSQLIKRAKLMLHQNALMSSQITELKKQLAEVIKCKECKRKRIQYSCQIVHIELSIDKMS